LQAATIARSRSTKLSVVSALSLLLVPFAFWKYAIQPALFEVAHPVSMAPATSTSDGFRSIMNALQVALRLRSPLKLCSHGRRCNRHEERLDGLPDCCDDCGKPCRHYWTIVGLAVVPRLALMLVICAPRMLLTFCVPGTMPSTEMVPPITKASTNLPTLPLMRLQRATNASNTLPFHCLKGAPSLAGCQRKRAAEEQGESLKRPYRLTSLVTTGAALRYA